MEILYKNTKINYICKNKGENAIVFLHGWGGSIASFSSLSEQLDNFSTKHILIDFPPFGKSEEPKEVWTLYDYVECIKMILDAENVKKVIFVAHSFGGRVAICFANLYTNKVQKMIITGGAGIKPKKSLKKSVRKIKYKIIRFFNKKAKVGSKDYRNLSPVMKKTFSNIVNLSVILEKIALLADTLFSSI